MLTTKVWIGSFVWVQVYRAWGRHTSRHGWVGRGAAEHGAAGHIHDVWTTWISATCVQQICQLYLSTLEGMGERGTHRAPGWWDNQCLWLHLIVMLRLTSVNTDPTLAARIHQRHNPVALSDDVTCLWRAGLQLWQVVCHTCTCQRS